MKLNIFCEDWQDLNAEALIFFNEKGKVALRGLASEANKHVGGKLSELIESSEFSSGQDSFFYFFTFDKVKIPRLGLVGFDLDNQFTLNPVRSAAAVVVKRMAEAGLKKIALVMPNVRGWEMSESSRAIVEGALLGLYKFDKYLSVQKKSSLNEIVLVGEMKDKRTLEKAVLLGEMEASGVMLTRDVGNEPSNILTPRNFAGIAKKMMEKVKVNCKIYDESDLKREGLGLICGVGKGSAEPPRLTILNYSAGKKYPTVGVVGKGITFDSGGISLKVGDAGGAGLFDMKRDMAGAGAVLGLMYVFGQLKPKINVVAALPMIENMPSSNAYKPGDILVSYSGKSVEIFNTDAEGRLALADAMSFVQENYKVDYLVDIATLTGEVMRVSGPAMIGVFGNDERLLERVRKAGVVAGEETMQWPLYKGYVMRVKSHFADVKNLSYKGPQAINSALFLNEFVEEGVKWAHLDIAAVAARNGDSTYLSRGATGAGVRLLTHLILGMGR